ncbi:aldehyde dehydrogenase family protein, partial [Caulobacter sp.]|uniref:aldehyde dehydrogenase family protein n=1 Tax=Caulobacter sp. TaxID=78 RepID=UPI002B4661E0
MTQSFPTPAAHARDLLDRLGVPALPADAGLPVRSPIDGSVLTHVAFDDAREIQAKIADACRAFDAWRVVPAPRRGELVRLFGEELR